MSSTNKMHFHPKVIYRTPGEDRQNSIIRYIGNRVLKNNKNFLCAVVGPTGSGKSWSAVSMAEIYSKMFNIEFNPEDHIVYSLKELLHLINNKDVDKKIRFGSVLVFDEPQIEANSRSWQSEINNILNQLISTFRNQRLVIFFCTPYLEFIDKQSRILFHGEFMIEGFDRNNKITKVKPRFLEFNKHIQDFYRKRLIVLYKSRTKAVYNRTMLGTWKVPKASEGSLRVYEDKKKVFTDKLNIRLQKSIDDMENSGEKSKKEYGVTEMERFIKFKPLYEKYGGDWVQISQELPLGLSVFQRYVQILKTGRKIAKNDEFANDSIQNDLLVA